MEPIRVLQNVACISAGGMETLVMNYYRNIDRTKVQFDFLIRLSEEESHYHSEEIRQLGGRIYRLPVNGIKNKLTFNKRLKAFLLEHPEYKIIHSHSDITSLFYLRVAKRVGIQTRIAHSHNTSQDKNVKGIVKKLVKPLLNSYCTDRFACGYAAGEWLFGRKYKDEIKVLPNSIAIEKFTYNESMRLQIRKELGFEHEIVLGNVSKFESQKNHTFLMGIFSEVLKIQPETKLLLVGEGSLKESIKEKAQQLGIDKNITFLNNRKDIHSIMMAIDVFVLPSLYEGLPFVMVEGQCAGVKCVVADTVPIETKMTEHYISVALQESPMVWAEKIVALGQQEGNRQDGASIIRNKGYDIKENVKWLQKFYLKKYNQ